MRVKSLVIGLGLVSLSALAACGSPNDKDTTEATASPAAASAPTAIAATEAAEAEYLAKVDAYVEQIDSMVESIGQALSQTWPVASRLFEVLGEANVSGTLETVLWRHRAAHPARSFPSRPRALRPRPA